MVGSRIIPCLLLKGRGLVKTVQFSNPKYIGDPINAVKIFNEKEVDELIFLDITATIEQRKPDFSLIKDIASECFMPLTIGGGINSTDAIYNVLNAGADKISINSKAIENQDFIRQKGERAF